MSFCVRHTSSAQHKCGVELFKQWFGIILRISTISMEKSLFRTKMSPSCISSTSLWLFIKCFTRIRHWLLSKAKWMQSTSSHPTLHVASCPFFLPVFRLRPVNFSYLPHYLHVLPHVVRNVVDLALFLEACKLRKILLANIFILCYSHNVRDRVSHSYRPFERAPSHYFYCKLGTQITLNWLVVIIPWSSSDFNSFVNAILTCYSRFQVDLSVLEHVIRIPVCCRNLNWMCVFVALPHLFPFIL